MMQERRSTLEQSEYRGTDAFSPACLVMSGVLFVLLGVLPIAPNMLVRVLRPVFMVACIFFPGRYVYKLTFERWQLLSLAYYTVIFLVHNITRNAVFVYVSLMLFILFFVFAVRRVWTRKEIVLLLLVVILACDVQAIVVLLSNANLFGESGVDNINYLNVSTNRNPIAFAIVPGALCSLLFLLNSRNAARGARFLLFTGSLLVCTFTVFAIGCRSAFGAMVVGAALLLWGKTEEDERASARILKKITIVLIFIGIYLIASSYAEGTYSARLFGNYSIDSGRQRIWDEAREMIRRKPIFGGGYDYWISGDINMGTHNTFLLTALYTGYVGVALLVVFLLHLY